MKILIIEDSLLYQKLNLNYLKAILPKAEYFVCGNGQEGYKTYLKERPDFIILDLLMPVMDGIEFLRLLKDQHPNDKTKIVIVSADVQSIVQEEVLSLGAVKFINKPFTPDKAEEIVSIIRGA